MKEYEVKITTTFVKDIRVEADSQEEAEHEVDDLIENGEGTDSFDIDTDYTINELPFDLTKYVDKLKVDLTERYDKQVFTFEHNKRTDDLAIFLEVKNGHEYMGTLCLGNYDLFSEELGTQEIEYDQLMEDIGQECYNAFKMRTPNLEYKLELFGGKQKKYVVMNLIQDTDRPYTHFYMGLSRVKLFDTKEGAMNWMRMSCADEVRSLNESEEEEELIYTWWENDNICIVNHAYEGAITTKEVFEVEI